MKTTRPLKYIILVIALLAWFGLKAQKSIMLDSIEIQIDKLIPQRANLISKKSKKVENDLVYPEGAIPDKVWISSNKMWISYMKYEAYNMNEALNPNSSLNMYNHKGELLWIKRYKNEQVSSCTSSDDGERHVIGLYKQGDGSAVFSIRFQVVDKTGKVLFQESEPVKYDISESKDFILYRYGKSGDEDFILCAYDIKQDLNWELKFENKFNIVHFTFNGDYNIVYSNNKYILINRKGEIIVEGDRNKFGGYIKQVSNDGQFILATNYSKETGSSFSLFNTKNKECSEFIYTVKGIEHIPGILETLIINGGCFVQNTDRLIALTSIVKPHTALLTIFDVNGNYVSQKLFENTNESFVNPSVVMLGNNKFLVHADGTDFGEIESLNKE